MKNSIAFLAVFLSAFSLKAQSEKKNSCIAVSIGAAVNYYYGQGDRNFGKFENERVNWQINGMIGLTLGRDKNDRRTMIGGFGSFGLNNASTVKQIFQDQGYITTATGLSADNNAYQVEGGLLIAEKLNISTGVGQQIFNKQSLASKNGINLGATSLKYNSTTVGLNFNAGLAALVLNFNFNYGQDYSETVINPSVGLNIRF